MADETLKLIAEALMGEATQKAVAAENPYLKFAAIPEQVSGEFLKQGLAQGITQGSFDWKDALFTQGLLGIAGGLGTGLGQNYSTTLLDRYQNAVKGKDVGGFLPESLFRRSEQAKEAATLSALSSQIARAQDIADTGAKARETARAKYDVLNEITGGMLFGSGGKAPEVPSTPSTVSTGFSSLEGGGVGQDTTVSATEGASTAAAPGKPAPPRDAPSLDRMRALAMFPGEVGEMARGYVKMHHSEQEAAMAKQKSKAQLEKMAFDVENFGTTNLAGSDQAKAFNDVSINFKKMMYQYQFEDAPAGFAFLAAFARINDPESVIRESERKAVESLGAKFPQYAAAIKRAATGESGLPQDVKDGIMRSAGATFNAFGEGYKFMEDQYKALITQRGGTPGAVVSPANFEPFNFKAWYDKHGGKFTTIDQGRKGGEPGRPKTSSEVERVARKRKKKIATINRISGFNLGN